MTVSLPRRRRRCSPADRRGRPELGRTRRRAAGRAAASSSSSAGDRGLAGGGGAPATGRRQPCAARSRDLARRGRHLGLAARPRRCRTPSRPPPCGGVLLLPRRLRARLSSALERLLGGSLQFLSRAARSASIERRAPALLLGIAGRRSARSGAAPRRRVCVLQRRRRGAPCSVSWQTAGCPRCRGHRRPSGQAVGAAVSLRAVSTGAAPGATVRFLRTSTVTCLRAAMREALAAPTCSPPAVSSVRACPPDEAQRTFLAPVVLVVRVRHLVRYHHLLPPADPAQFRLDRGTRRKPA